VNNAKTEKSFSRNQVGTIIETHFFSPVSKPASGEISQNNAGHERRKGHSKFCRSQGNRANEVGAKDCRPWF
jgi:hypothetical protein